MTERKRYRGRLAPSPTGYLHLGHAFTFWTAQKRAAQKNGVLVLRNEDLDQQRCKPGFLDALVDDLQWLGIDWHEGTGKQGPHAPYNQSERLPLYERAFAELKERGLVYPCTCSKQDVMRALSAPHENNDEPVYPGTCLSKPPTDLRKACWRFRVPLETEVRFTDGRFGEQSFVSGKDFGDFVVWRNDSWPSYQLAVVVDDAGMEITEVVRGQDLLLSTARQILLYRALGLQIPEFYHTPLLCDATGEKLSKRHQSITIRSLRERGFSAEQLRSWWQGDDQTVPFASVLQS